MVAANLRAGDPIEERVAAIERRQDALEDKLKSLVAEMAENTETTRMIKKDTAEIVTLFKASQLGATLVKWLATVGGGLIIAYAAFKGLKP